MARLAKWTSQHHGIMSIPRNRSDVNFLSVIVLCLMAWAMLVAMTLSIVASGNDSGSSSSEVVPTTTIPIPPPRVLLVGDSTMAAMRWFRDGEVALKGASFVVSVESCRSVAGYSCYGREKRIPSNAMTVIRTTPGPLDAVVLMAGTHSESETIEREFRRIQNVTEKMGVKLIILTLRDFSPKIQYISKKGRAKLVAINKALVKIADESPSGSTYIADWKSFSSGHNNWFRRDGIHLNLRGVLGLDWFISQTIAHVFERPCPWNEVGVCAMPTPVDSLRDWLSYFNVKYTDSHCYEDGGKREKVCEQDRRMP